MRHARAGGPCASSFIAFLLGIGGSGKEVVPTLQNLTSVPGATLNELPRWAADLLHEIPVAHLGLLDDAGRPRVLPITFARVGDALWSAVDDKPKRVAGERLARVRWLHERPRAALTIDRYDDDWTRLAWVQALGDVAILGATGNAEVLEALAARYPAYRERTPRGPLLKLTPARVLWWRAGKQ
jgi:PPOX class probable F420-dependent enzyme